MVAAGVLSVGLLEKRGSTLTEHVGFGEGSENGYLVAEDLGRGPRDTGGVGVDTKRMISSCNEGTHPKTLTRRRRACRRDGRS